MLCDRLATTDAVYSNLQAHDGLRQAAHETADGLSSRLAIAPLVLQARGFDVMSAMIDRLQAGGDLETAAAFNIIVNDEIGHVAIGNKWFDYVCGMQRRDPVST